MQTEQNRSHHVVAGKVKLSSADKICFILYTKASRERILIEKCKTKRITRTGKSKESHTKHMNTVMARTNDAAVQLRQ